MKLFAGALAVLFSVAGTSAPGERSITRIDPPAVAGAMAPNLVATDGGFLLSWLEPVRPGGKPGEGEWALRFTRLAVRGWDGPRTIAAGTDFFVNWADFPSVAASDGTLLAHWAAMSGPGKYSYDVALARSNDGGTTWRRIGKAHDDATESEHGFVSMLPEGRAIRAFWLDGRSMSSGGHGHAEAGGDMALYTTTVGERAGKGELLDTRTCECCQTSAAVTASGPVIVYRDRSADEVRDISIVRRVGGRWTKPAPVHDDGWKIAGCPVNGPAAAASGGRVAVAWFTGAQDRPRVLAALSEDAGASFSKPAEVDAREPLGRVDVVLDGNGDAIVSWVAKGSQGAEIRVRRVSAARAMGEPLTVAKTTSDRTSGFPRMKRSGEGKLLLAWVESGDSTRLRAAWTEARNVPATRASSSKSTRALK